MIVMMISLLLISLCLKKKKQTSNDGTIHLEIHQKSEHEPVYEQITSTNDKKTMDSTENKNLIFMNDNCCYGNMQAIKMTECSAYIQRSDVLH